MKRIGPDLIGTLKIDLKTDGLYNRYGGVNDEETCCYYWIGCH